MDIDDQFYGNGLWGLDAGPWFELFTAMTQCDSDDYKCQLFPCCIGPGSAAMDWYDELPEHVAWEWRELSTAFEQRWRPGPVANYTWDDIDLDFLAPASQWTTAPRTNRLLHAAPKDAFQYQFPELSTDELELRQAVDDLECGLLEALEELLRGIEVDVAVRQREGLEEVEAAARTAGIALYARATVAQEAAARGRILEEARETRRHEERLAKVEALIRQFEEEDERVRAEEARRQEEAATRASAHSTDPLLLSSLDASVDPVLIDSTVWWHVHR